MDLPKVFEADYLDQHVLDGFLWDCSSVKDLTVSGQLQAGRLVQILTQEEHALTPTVEYLQINAPSVEKLQLRLRPSWWRGGFKILVNSRNLKTFTFSSGAAYAYYSRDETYDWADGFWRGCGFHVYCCIIGSSSTTFYGEVVERPDACDMPFYFVNDPHFKFPVRLRVHLEEDFKGGAWLFYLLGCFQRLTDVNIMKGLSSEHDLIIPEVRDPEDAHDGFKWCTN
ncbi:hypothetical protein CRG98_013396 [Punica granatum]|uniref:Uncharacterized protein n=1 Tax=Punica granatum TaxID=22663 RepID=A0A2I0KCH4_PUNGR|nr:hypothetical protein CRG98_013396 [Punica granatum]